MFKKSLFSTANLAFTDTTSIYNLVIKPINTEIFILKLLGDAKVMYHSEQLSIKYHEQKLCIKFNFSGQHLTGFSIDKFFKKSVFGVFNKNINISTEYQY